MEALLGDVRSPEEVDVDRRKKRRRHIAALESRHTDLESKIRTLTTQIEAEERELITLKRTNTFRFRLQMQAVVARTRRLGTLQAALLSTETLQMHLENADAVALYKDIMRECVTTHVNATAAVDDFAVTVDDVRDFTEELADTMNSHDTSADDIFDGLAPEEYIEKRLEEIAHADLGNAAAAPTTAFRPPPPPPPPAAGGRPPALLATPLDAELSL